MYDLPPAADQRGRIALFFGQELADDLIWVESRDEQTMLRGYVARPSQSRAHARMQYMFLNGRHIRDRRWGTRWPRPIEGCCSPAGFRSAF